MMLNPPGEWAFPSISGTAGRSWTHIASHPMRQIQVELLVASELGGWRWCFWHTFPTSNVTSEQNGFDMNEHG